ncbi:MAG: tRNA (adenine(22)-N(1))-methyltransferase [Lentihominibacter sp.]
MNRLTDRLQLMADQIKQGETMADIGTDHGFLPLYLWQQGISPAVIMCDISEPSLAKAKAAAADFQFGSELDFRTGDGLKVLDFGEVDAIVIAGMGGLLIRDILSDNPEKTRSFSRFILQPRNNSGQLRYWLEDNGFEITSNHLVREGKFICEVIVAASEKSPEKSTGGFVEQHPDRKDPYWEFPPDMARSNPVLASELALTKIKIEEKIKAGIMRSCNVSDTDIHALDRRIEYFGRFR